MMRPLGLYLAEFRPDAPTAGTAPTVTPQALFPQQGSYRDGSMPDLSVDPATSALEDTPFPAIGDADDDAAFAPLPDPVVALTAALAAQQAEHDTSLLAARAAWATTEGAVLAHRMTEGLAALEARLADALGPLLQPFLAKAAQAKALDELRETLATLLAGDETRPVTVSGPADLLAALRDSHGDRPGLSFTEADAPDVTITLDETRIRSHLRAWTRTLDTALHALPGAHP